MMLRIYSIILTFFTVPAVQGQCALDYMSINPICNRIFNGQVAGIYILKVVSGNNIDVVKIVKE